MIVIAGLTVAYLVGLFLYSRDRLDALIHLGLGNTAQTFALITHTVAASGPDWRPDVVKNISEPHLRTSLSENPLYPDAAYEGPYGGIFRQYLRRGARADELDRARVQFLDLPLSKTTAVHRDALSEMLLHVLRSIYGLPIHLNINVSVPLDDGAWLNMSFEVPELPIELWSPSLTTVGVMTFAIILISILVVRQTLRPLREFAFAARRFSSDIHSPPMPKNGAAEVHDVAAAFNEMQENVRNMIRSRSEMMGALSHDLRTPLALIRLRTEALEPSEERAKLLASISDMEAFVAATLGLARQAFDMEERQSIDLGALLQAVCDDLSDTGGDVAFTDLVGQTRVSGQPVALRRAFSNLIENSIRYGGRVRVSLESTHGLASVYIEDDGPGIPESELQKVFEPFYRGDRSRSSDTEGTGLGLSLAKTIIQNHGGGIELINRRPGGLLARVTLPC